jgi:threonine dehydratase
MIGHEARGPAATSTDGEPGPASREALIAGAGLTARAVADNEPVIRGYVRFTPAITINRAELGLVPDGPLTLKLELLQHSGSFKARGAFTNLLRREVPPAGVVAASGGNHGAAVAYAASVLGIPAKIFVPEVSSRAKTARIRGYGADLVVTGETYSEALAASRDWAGDSGALQIHAFDQPETILGAGTAGLELSRQVPAAQTVLTAVGGGGLLAGTALALAGEPVKVIGAEPEGAPTMTLALAAGRPVDAPAGSVAVDSLAPRQVGELTLAVAATLVDSVRLVSDDAIRQAQQLLWERLRIVAEPGACAPLAALISGAYQPASGEHVAVVVSGANTTAVDFSG